MPHDRKVKFEAISDVVREIAADPATTGSSAQDPRRLPTQRGHHHFLGLLRDWYSTLKGIGTDQQEETPRRRFDNYYVVLELDEDFFPDEGTFAVESGAPRSVRDERERLFNESFAQDLRLEVVYFFLELGELVEGVVFRIYDQVKKQQRYGGGHCGGQVGHGHGHSADGETAAEIPRLKSAEDVVNVVMEDTPQSNSKKIS
ncbi:hypothetical protein KRP22_005480 [Phytophthora ramorum]|nr:hypothetical protein KRP22_3388 [Phytophthora ramorum]